MNKTKQQKNHSQINIRLMNIQQIQSQNNEPARQKSSLLTSFLTKLCPCMSSSPKKSSSNNDLNKNNHEQTKFSISTKNNQKNDLNLGTKKYQPTTFQTLVEQKKNNNAFASLQQFDQKIHLQDIQSKSTLKKWHFYPINQLKQEQLITVGNLKSILLCKIRTIGIQPSLQSKNLTKKSKKYQSEGTTSTRTYLDKYWHKRYYLFSKFDEGVSLIENSWPITIPQAVSQHIASKIKYDTVMNLCCGVGGDAIKLSNTCNKVIAWDPNENNLNCLAINKKIYEVDNLQILNKVQLQSIKVQPQATLISSYLKLQEDCLSKPTISPSSFKPQLSELVHKSLQYSSNIILVLPANINLTQIAYLLTSQFQLLDIKPQTCCMKVQKIYYLSQFKYVIVYFGEQIGRSLAINDQLLWVYRKLGIENKGSIAGKKFIKKMREMFGMIKLLNYIIEAIAEQSGQPMIRLYKFIKNRKLVGEEKLNKIFQQYKLEKQRSQTNNIANQNNTQEDSEYQQKTISDVSISSTNRISTDQLFLNNLNNQQAYDPYKSLPMQIRDSFNPKSIYSNSNIADSSYYNNISPSKKSFSKKTKQVERQSTVQLYNNK